MVVVHGWRTYRLSKALVQGEEHPVLVGGRTVVVDEQISKAASCLGFDQYAAWLREESCQMPAEERHLPGTRAPQFHCTCGYYGYRLFPEDVEAGEATDSKIVFAHASVIGSAVIHPEGWRAAAVRLDYIIPVRHVPVPVGGLIATKYGPPQYKDVWFDDVITGVATRAGVPVLPFDHEDACAECVEAHRESKHPGPSWPEAWVPKEEE